MRLKRYIEEEWATRVDSIKKDVDIFVNPDKKDLREIGKECRFIAYNNRKKLYVWDANKSFHYDVYKMLFGNKASMMSFDECMEGVAEKQGMKWKMTGSDRYDDWSDEEYSPDKMLKWYSWVNKWINIKEYFGQW